MKNILIIASNGTSLINFRLPLIKEFLSKGYNVCLASPKNNFPERYKKILLDLNININYFSLSNTEINFIQDLKSCFQIYKIIKTFKPDIIISYTIKPVIFTGLVLKYFKKIKYYPLITGLGYTFIDRHSIKHKILKYLVIQMYKVSLKSSEKIIFQNNDDRDFFYELKILKNRNKSHVVNGSGVDLNKYPFSKLPAKPIFLMIARLLIDKGVREYAKAAKIVKSRFPDAIFQLAGYLDKNPACIKKAELDSWIKNGDIQYLGEVNSVHSILISCKYYVLPSYREGTPRSTLEALSTGRPVITTDVPGCRETIVHEQNGLIVPAKDTVALANAMIKLLNVSDEKTKKMAYESRLIAENKYEINKVNKSIIDIMNL